MRSGSATDGNDGSTTQMFEDLDAIRSVGTTEGNSLILDPSWFTTNITGLYAMFRHCDRLETVSLPTINKAANVSMAAAFKDCPKLQSFTMTSTTQPGATPNFHQFFKGCTSLKSVHFLGNSSPFKPVNMNEMFSGCASLEDAYLYALSTTDLRAYDGNGNPLSGMPVPEYNGKGTENAGDRKSVV